MFSIIPKIDTLISVFIFRLRYTTDARPSAYQRRHPPLRVGRVDSVAGGGGGRRRQQRRGGQFLAGRPLRQYALVARRQPVETQVAPLVVVPVPAARRLLALVEVAREPPLPPPPLPLLLLLNDLEPATPRPSSALLLPLSSVETHANSRSPAAYDSKSTGRQ